MSQNNDKVPDLEKALANVPKEALEEVLEYEEQVYGRKAGGKKKGRYPSNEDIVEAIKEVSGGVLTRYNVDVLFEAVKQYLEERGFDTSALNESRFWRLVTNLVKKGHLRAELE
jgi:GTPase SAR1 family protein